MLRMLDIPVSDIRKILYEKEALTSVLNTHLLKIKEEENRLRQNYFFCEELIKMDMSVTDLTKEYLPLYIHDIHLQDFFSELINFLSHKI